jgi:NADH-quinone oxidoreductase subunit J
MWMSTDLFLFLTLAMIAVVSAGAMLFSTNAIYAALYLIVNFCTIAVFYLLLGAPFLAMVQITVYAGAIMVLFLFVIMLLGAERLRRSRTLWWQQPLAIALGLLLFVEAAYALLFRSEQNSLLPPFSSISPGYGNPRAIGEVLFNQYLLPFEMTSFLLLIAIIGAIVLTKSEKR